MFRRYHENPLSHRLTKWPSPEYHCRTLIRIFGDEARKDQTNNGTGGDHQPYL